MKRLLVAVLFGFLVFPSVSMAQVMSLGGSLDADLQIVLVDQGKIEYNECVTVKYLATTDQNQKNLIPEESQLINPEWQTPRRVEPGQYPRMSGVYRFKASAPKCGKISFSTDVGNNYVLLEHLVEYFEGTKAVELMMKEGFTVDKLVPKPKKGGYHYYVLVGFYKSGDLKNIPKDSITVGHLVPDHNGFLHQFVKQGDAYPFEPFLPFVRVYWQKGKKK